MSITFLLLLFPLCKKPPLPLTEACSVCSKRKKKNCLGSFFFFSPPTPPSGAVKHKEQNLLVVEWPCSSLDVSPRGSPTIRSYNNSGRDLVAGDISPRNNPICNNFPTSSVTAGLSQWKALSGLFSLLALELSLGGESSLERRLGEISEYSIPRQLRGVFHNILETDVELI